MMLEELEEFLVEFAEFNKTLVNQYKKNKTLKKHNPYDDDGVLPMFILIKHLVSFHALCIDNYIHKQL